MRERSLMGANGKHFPRNQAVRLIILCHIPLMFRRGNVTSARQENVSENSQWAMTFVGA
jgi:hypothetical protein